MNPILPVQQAYKDFQSGHADRAERSLKALLGNQPENIDALHVLGVICAATGKRDEAIRLFKQAIGLATNNPALAVPLHYKLARAQFESGRFDEALLAYEHILSTGYLKPEILLAKTVTLASLTRYQDALHCIEHALAHWTDYAEGWSHRAGILYKLGYFDEALASFDRAVALQPATPCNWYQKGMTLDKLERYADALESIDRAITLDPDNPAHWLDRGVLRHKLGRYEEALSDHATGLKLAPDNAAAWGDQGLTLSRIQRHEEALDSYRKALHLQHDYADVLSNQALSQLVLGQFEQGWQSYEYRWKKGNADTPRHTDIPLWLGATPISGKRILLWAEQGLGDTIHFCRYAPMVAAPGAEVILEVDPSLKTIAQTMGREITVIGIGETVPQVDYQTPLMSLALAFKSDLDTIPATIPNGQAYFYSDDAKALRWKTRQDLTDGKLRIGLVCCGNPFNTNDQQRSMRLAEFAPLLQSAAADFFLIQKEVRETDLAFLHHTPKLRLAATDITDFDDTAAIIANLDLVISVDTSIAHLAAALGKPVWILLPWAPDWRWLLERNDSPWYPSARLFRQQQAGAWPDVMRRVADALQVWQAGSNLPPD
ncbi:tetratricopeptide repeat protein [Collimonas sp.]|jgi:tetratricopeptide (TPR) repeat protein|uniref:tetratricopeptide repeat protein n=1 Tax=Collimonas sp. TaxID=1963772 RepID=UPI0037C02413